MSYWEEGLYTSLAISLPAQEQLCQYKTPVYQSSRIHTEAVYPLGCTCVVKEVPGLVLGAGEQGSHPGHQFPGGTVPRPHWASLLFLHFDWPAASALL